MTARTYDVFFSADPTPRPVPSDYPGEVVARVVAASPEEAEAIGSRLAEPAVGGGYFWARPADDVPGDFVDVWPAELSYEDLRDRVRAEVRAGRMWAAPTDEQRADFARGQSLLGEIERDGEVS